MRTGISRTVLACLLPGALSVMQVADAAAPDRIFSGKMEETLVIEGKAGWAVPLAGARVELRFGENSNTATTAADGSFSVGVELGQLDGEDILELTARGTGAQSKLVWASPLGPAQRLLDLAGAGHRVDFAMEPFVNLNPRTTTAAAMMRAINGGAPIMDAKDFYRAALARHSVSIDLVFALAAVERAALDLPATAGTTFDAVAEPALARALVEAYEEEAYGNGSPIIDEIVDTLPTATDVYPAMDWVDGSIYSKFLPNFDTPVPRNSWGFMTTGGSGLVLSNNEDKDAIAADVVTTADGARSFSGVGGVPLDVFETYDYIGGQQVRSVQSTVEVRSRLLSGPGGTLEMQEAVTVRKTYPDNPELDPVETTYAIGGALPATDGVTEPALVPDIPLVANRAFVLPTVLPAPAEGNPDNAPDYFSGFGVAVHHFAAGDGNLERFGTPFDFTQATGGTRDLQLVMDGWQVAVQFIVEQEPGTWQVRLHGVKGSQQAVATGVLLEVDESAGFTAGTVPGHYESTINGCRGTYGQVDSHCLPVVGSSFLAGGEMDVWWGVPLSGPSVSGQWWLGTGTDAGKLAMERKWDGGLGLETIQIRGWQLVRQDGPHFWVLENLHLQDPDSGQVAPISFSTPTNRLIRYDRQP